jgi:hypothetical protein
MQRVPRARYEKIGKMKLGGASSIGAARARIPGMTKAHRKEIRQRFNVFGSDGVVGKPSLPGQL